MNAARIVLRDGQSIEVSTEGDEVVIRNGALWYQRLTREEAWQLAEAIDAVATGDDRGQR